MEMNAEASRAVLEPTLSCWATYRARIAKRVTPGKLRKVVPLAAAKDAPLAEDEVCRRGAGDALALLDTVAGLGSEEGESERHRTKMSKFITSGGGDGNAREEMTGKCEQVRSRESRGC